MEKISLIVLTLILSTNFALAQDKKIPKAEFDTLEHDFGKIIESDEDITVEFKLKNIGNAPLIIQRISTTCGCTTSDYTRTPILPGKEGTIKVSYETKGRPFVFNKKVTVFSNVPDQVYVLTIKGEVTKKK